MMPETGLKVRGRIPGAVAGVVFASALLEADATYVAGFVASTGIVILAAWWLLGAIGSLRDSKWMRLVAMTLSTLSIVVFGWSGVLTRLSESWLYYVGLGWALSVLLFACLPLRRTPPRGGRTVLVGRVALASLFGVLNLILLSGMITGSPTSFAWLGRAMLASLVVVSCCGIGAGIAVALERAADLTRRAM